MNALIDGTHGAFFTGGITSGAPVRAATDVGLVPEASPVHVFEIVDGEGKGEWPARRNTLAQAIGGSEFVAALVWANKPEFRGEVDEDCGLRAGLKWSLGNGKKN